MRCGGVFEGERMCAGGDGGYRDEMGACGLLSGD